MKPRLHTHRIDTQVTRDTQIARGSDANPTTCALNRMRRFADECDGKLVGVGAATGAYGSAIAGCVPIVGSDNNEQIAAELTNYPEILIL